MKVGDYAVVDTEHTTMLEQAVQELEAVTYDGESFFVWGVKTDKNSVIFLFSNLMQACQEVNDAERYARLVVKAMNLGILRLARKQIAKAALMQAAAE